jgi:beta-lactamase superfamily II metal-dependent hydrolase
MYQFGIWLREYRPPGPQLPRGPQLRIKVIDVGAGCSELLTVDTGGTLLIDTGPDGPGGDAVAAAVGPHASIDLVILTSTRVRCIGGLPELIAHTHIGGPVLLPCSVHDFLRYGGQPAIDAVDAMHEHDIKAVPFDQFLLEHSNAHTNPVRADCPIQIAGVTLITPGPHHISLAVRVEYGVSALLYAGGLNAEDERTLLTRDADLDCDILCVPDGGSDGTAMPELLALANPVAAVISSDHDDPPDAQTLSWLNAADLKIGRTDLMSTFSLLVDAEPGRPIEWRVTPGPNVAIHK